MLNFKKTPLSSARDQYLVTLYDGARVFVRAQNLSRATDQQAAIRQARDFLLDYLEEGHDAGLIDLYGDGFSLSICKEPGESDLTEFNRSERTPW